MNKYARQRGLVAQDLVADAELAIYGSGPALTYLLQCLTLAGFGTRHGRIWLCLADRPVSEDDLTAQFLLQPDDIGRPLGDALADRVMLMDDAVDIDVAATRAPSRALGVAVPTPAEVAGLRSQPKVAAWGQVLPTSVFIGPEPLRTVPEEGPNVLTAALAAVCGALLAQTVLTQLGAVIDGPAVLSSWFEERLWISYPGIGALARTAEAEGAIAPMLSGVLHRLDPAAAEPLRITVAGLSAKVRVTTIVDEDAIVVSVPVNPAAEPHAHAVERPSLVRPGPVQPLLWSPVEGPELAGDQVVQGDIPVPDRLPPLRVVLCGVGALGSWASAVIAASRLSDVDICLVDMDDAVEAHNLNRQVLFGNADIGLPKALRAVTKLSEIDPKMRLQALQIMVDPGTLDEIFGGVRPEISDPVLAAELNAYRAQIDELGKALRRATVILSCPDNHRTRWCLNVISERLGIPLINGAVEGFVGLVHVCDSADNGRCLVCWLTPSIAQEPERRSCTDIVGDAPVPAIVTSAAVIGAAQAAALIVQAAGLNRPIKRYHAFDAVKLGTLDGVPRVFSGYRAAGRDPAECPAHLFGPLEPASMP